jgi:signal transduction histidine kinase
MNGAILSLEIRNEGDMVSARQRARQIAARLGFDATEQTRIATAVSEIARNAFTYAGGGRISFSLDGSSGAHALVIRVKDQGPGIAALDDVVAGVYRSTTGMGLGIAGARRLMDGFDVESTSKGTLVTLRKIAPSGMVLGPEAISELAATLARERPSDALDEMQTQNRELIQTLGELQARREDLDRVTRELEDTNRGVVALYSELDERATHLRRVDELKTRFLSNMTHEFRTPLNSILALTTLLAERLQTTPDQKDEVFYIRRSAQQLSDLVDDLLDIAKVEAGTPCGGCCVRS